MRILAGVDTAIDGDIQLDPSYRVGYLEQEPKLDAGETVMENIEPAVKRVRDMLKEFENVSGELQLSDQLLLEISPLRLFLQKEISEGGFTSNARIRPLRC